MTREQLRDAMLVSGELDRFKKTDNWKLAFELYKGATRNYEVSLECSSCYNKVKAWLTK